MALVAVGGHLVLPKMPNGLSGPPSLNSQEINADGESLGMVFQAPATGNITGVGFRTATLTTSDTAVIVQLLNTTTGSTPILPSTTVRAQNTSVTLNASNTWVDVTFAAPYAATQGELLAVNVERASGGSLSTLITVFQDEAPSSAGFPYLVQDVGAGWVAASASGSGFAVNYGGTYHHMATVWPVSDVVTHSYNSGSTPDVYGNVFVPPWPCRVVGLWAAMDLDGAAVLNLYDTDGATVLGTCTALQHMRSSDAAKWYALPFDDAVGAASVTLARGSTYRIGIEPSSATNLNAYSFTVSATALMNAFDLGASMYRTSAKNPAGVGDWTDTTTARMFMGVLIDQIDDGTGSGSGAGAWAHRMIGGGF